MKKNAVRHQIVEHISRLGYASIHQVGSKDETYARIYHFHNTLEVIIVKQGWMEGLISGMTGKMHKGTVVVIGDDVPHCVLRASADCKVILVHIPADLLKWDEERFPELTHGIDYIRQSKSGMVYQDVHFSTELARLAGKIAAAEGFMRMSLIMRMLHALSTTKPTSTLLTGQQHSHRHEEKESPIDRAYRYVYTHFRENFSLEELADFAGLCPAALCRAFKKSAGCTIGQICGRLRLEYACNLLLTTNMNAGEIACMAGFNSYPHFCTQFKKMMNMSPTAYRGATVYKTT